MENRSQSASMENQTGSQSHLKHRVILFPFPLQGHLNPMLHLASILYSRGFSITIIHTQFNSPDSSNYPHFKFCSFHEGLSESEASTSDIMSFHLALNSKYFVPFQDCLAKVLSQSDQKCISLIADSTWDFSKVASQGVGVPWMMFYPSSLCSFLVTAAWPILVDKGYFPIKGAHQFPI